MQIYKSMNALLGTKVRTVSGYPGGDQINLAIERGEMHGRCALSWSSVKATLQHWLDDKKLHVLLQVASAKHADLPDVPSLMDLAPSDEARQIFRFLVARQVMGRPFFGPPDVPADRAAALRKAFLDTLADKEFLAEADKAKLEINPVPAGAHRGLAEGALRDARRRRETRGGVVQLTATAQCPSPRRRPCAPPAAGRSNGGSLSGGR